MNKRICLLIWMVAFLCMPQLYSKEKFTVVIDPGHGGKDPGAKGSLVNEKVINLAVALKLGEMITSNHGDVDVIYTRKTDRFIELSERANIANKNKADLFISIHTNSVRKGNAVKGTETFTLGLAKTEENLAVAMLENSAILLEDNYLQRYGGFDPNSSESYIIFEFMQNKYMEQSVSFASEIQKAFSAANRVNRGVRQAGFLVLKATSMPSVLVELGFISNRDEERYMRSVEGQTQLASAIYRAFEKYKKEYSRKQGTVDGGNMLSSAENVAQSHESSKDANSVVSSQSPSSSAMAGKVVYKVQILSSNEFVPVTSSAFKGYKVDYHKVGSSYKYTYGESTDMKAIQQIQKDLAKDFKGSFIVRMKDGKRLE